MCYKSSEAAQPRGQHRRLHQPELGAAAGPASASRLSLSVEGEYNDLSEDDGYKVSGVFSNTFADDSMGLHGHGHLPGHAGPLGRGARVLHQPGFPGEFDADGDGDISPAESDLLGLCCTSFGARIQQKERSGVTAVLPVGQSATASA